ncbi:hypothetical protein ACEPAF_6114 [Sanghuangporus sanghuang]
MRISERFNKGRVFIVGNAAHVHPPTGGQGLNTSIQDSFNLAWKLAFSLKKQASPILLNSYESERMPVIVETFNMMTELFNKLAARMGQRGLETTEVQTEATEKDKDKQTFLRGWKHYQPDVNYRWSEIVFDERFTSSSRRTGAKRRIKLTHTATRSSCDRAPEAPGLEASGGILALCRPLVRRLQALYAYHTRLHARSFWFFCRCSPRIILTDSEGFLLQKALICPPETSVSDSGSIPLNVEYAFRDAGDHVSG